MEGNAGTHNLHVFVVILRSSLTWAEGTAVGFFELALLFEQEIGELLVRGELEAQRLHDLREEIPQRSLSRDGIHG